MSETRRDPSAYARQIAESTKQYLALLRHQNETLHQLVDGLRGEEPDDGAPETSDEELQEALSAAEREAARLQELVSNLRDELGRHRRSRATLQRQLNELAEENRGYSQRFTQLEQQVSQLASLFTATFRLHEAINPDDLWLILDEIVVNMLGSEELAVYDVPVTGDRLQRVHQRGMEHSPAPAEIRFGQGRIGKCAAEASIYVADRHGSGEGSESELTACVPLVRNGRVLAVVAIFRLLPHRHRLEKHDEELLEVLSNDGGCALDHARLRRSQGAEAA